MATSTPNLHTAGSVLPVRQDAACGGIGDPAPSSLCTLLPPAEPTYDTSPCWHFVSTDFQEYVADHELAAFHTIFQAAGTPYTVQHQPIHPLEPDDHLDWYTHPALTADQRNALSY